MTSLEPAQADSESSAGHTPPLPRSSQAERDLCCRIPAATECRRSLPVAINFGVLVSPCVKAVLPLIPPQPSRSWSRNDQGLSWTGGRRTGSSSTSGQSYGRWPLAQAALASRKNHAGIRQRSRRRTRVSIYRLTRCEAARILCARGDLNRARPTLILPEFGQFEREIELPLTPVSSSWSAERATRCGTVSILTSCPTTRTADSSQPTHAVRPAV